VIVLPGAARAQRYELTPYVGYRWGGEFRGGNYVVGGATTVSDLKINDNPGYGLYFSYEAVPAVHLELGVEAQPTSLERRGHAERPDSALFDLSLYYIHGGMLYELVQGQQSRIRPYFGFTLGVTHLAPEGSRSGETQFSGGFSLGAKTYVTRSVAVRIQGRFTSTYIGDGEKFFCDENDNCQSYNATTYLTQWDVSLGLSFGI
jgi:hypothetical protein